jgi:hypothetical protein
MNQDYNYQAPAPVQQQPNTLVFGILSLVLGSLVGIILGSIGRKKGNEYVLQGGTLTGASKAGYILSKLGIIFGIIELVVIVIYTIIIIAGVGAGITSGAFDSLIDF